MSVNEFDDELLDDIKELVSQGRLEEGTAAHGIALKVVDDGYDSLSDKQRAVYDEHIVPLLTRLHERREWDRKFGNDD